MSRKALPPELHHQLLLIAQKIEELVRELNVPQRADQAIHDIRTSCKRFLAILQLARKGLAPAQYAELKRLVKKVKDAVARARDAHVMSERLAQLMPDHSPSFPLPVRSLPQAALVAELASDLKNATTCNRFSPLPSPKFLAALRRSYRRAVHAAAKSGKHPESHTLHQWRKRVKALAYQLSLLPSSPCAAEMEKKCRALGSLLGEHHDYAVLLQRLDQIGARRHPARSKIRQHQKEVEKRCLALGKKLFQPAPEKIHQLLKKDVGED